MQAPVCPDCFAGTLRGDVLPTGREEVVHGLPTYVTGPDPGVEPLGVVVIIPDAFGWQLRNTRALADAYAKRVPCTVFLPDFMDGHAAPASVLKLVEAKPPLTASLPARLLARTWTLLRLIPLMARFLLHTRYSVTHPRVLAFLRAVRTGSAAAPRADPQTQTQPGDGESRAGAQATKLGVAGFCWGGLHAVRLTHDIPENKVEVPCADGADHGSASRPLVDCAFTAHPSLLSLPRDMEAVAQPLSVANGDDDAYMGRQKMARLVSALEGKNEKAGTEVHEAVVYQGAKHGFAVRGDPADALQRERGERSEEQAVRWFRRWFGEDC